MEAPNGYVDTSRQRQERRQVLRRPGEGNSFGKRKPGQFLGDNGLLVGGESKFRTEKGRIVKNSYAQEMLNIEKVEEREAT